MKRLISIILALTLLLSVCFIPVDAASQTVVEQRLAQIVKLYPQDSTFDHWVKSSYIEYGGCGGLVAFATRKIFHNAYYDDSPEYKKIGTASTTNNAQMQSLFKKAKVGDVIHWNRESGSTAHLAIFLKYSSSGVYIYEANFGGPNQVWYNHFWPWSGMDDWPSGGAKTVSVYRSKNYDKVNKGTAAQKIKVGETIEYIDEYDNIYTDEHSNTYIKFKILDNSINNPLAVVTEYTVNSNYDSKKAPVGSFIYYKSDSPKGYNISICGEFSQNEFFVNFNEYFKVLEYDQVAPKKVKKLAVNNKKKKSLTLTWKKTKNTTGYQIFRSTEKDGVYKKIKKLKGADKLTFTDKNVQKKTTYYYKVRGYRKYANTTFLGKFSGVCVGTAK